MPCLPAKRAHLFTFDASQYGLSQGMIEAISDLYGAKALAQEILRWRK